jgi:hypothetical protein
MVWVHQLLIISVALCGMESVRTLLRSRWAWIDAVQFDTIVLMLLAGCLGMTLLTYRRDNREKAHTAQRVRAAEQTAHNLRQELSTTREHASALQRARDDAMARLEHDLEAVRHYADMARLNIIGRPACHGEDKDSPSLATMLETTYTLERNGAADMYVSFNIAPEADTIYRAVIKHYPRFPFAYALLGLSLKAQEDVEWRIRLHEAREILEQTTRISGHDADHDKMLQAINATLQENA